MNLREAKTALLPSSQLTALFRSRFGFLLWLVAAVAVLCASFQWLPLFARFIPSFAAFVFKLNRLAASIAAFVVTAIKQPFLSERFWQSLWLALLLGAWVGVGVGYRINLNMVSQPQWPNIGGALIICGAGMLTAFCTAALLAACYPRRRAD